LSFCSRRAVTHQQGTAHITILIFLKNFSERRKELSSTDSTEFFTIPRNKLIDILNYDQEVKGDKLVDAESDDYKSMLKLRDGICKDFSFSKNDWKFFKNLLLLSLNYDQAINNIL